MEITENTFIDILGLPEWDDRVIEVLEAVELKRPIPKKGETDIFLKSEKYGIELFFDETVTIVEQEKYAESGTLFLDQISFNMNTSLPLPFAIIKEDNYLNIVEKIGTDANYLNIPMAENKASWFFKNINNFSVRLALVFHDDSLEGLNRVWIRVEEE